MFGRATIRLGIGPHSSLLYNPRCKSLIAAFDIHYLFSDRLSQSHPSLSPSDISLSHHFHQSRHPLVHNSFTLGLKLSSSITLPTRYSLPRTDYDSYRIFFANRNFVIFCYDFEPSADYRSAFYIFIPR